MRIRNTIIFLLFSVTLAFAQTKIQGTVRDGKGNAIPGANIFIKDSYDGTTTNENGDFAFVTTETGAHTLLVKFIGYKEYKQALLIENKDLHLELELEEEINELEAVTISAGTFTASDASRRTVFRAVDIATTAGATADIAGALNTLPGTQKVGESGRLFVRGGDGNEVRTFIDGMVVLDAYRPSAPNTPSRGRFLPFMFKGTSFSTGGYSAEYGQALSSVLALESKDESETTRTDIGILSVGGDIAHTQAWARGSLAGKIQYTNLRPYMGLINQRIDWKSMPVSIEGVAAFRQKIGKQGMLKLYGNFNQANFSLYNHDIDDHTNTQLYDLTNNYRYVNGFYKNALNNNWMLRGGLSYTSIQNETYLDNIRLFEIEKGIHAKAVTEGSLSDHVELKTGVEVINRNYNRSVTLLTTEVTTTFNEAIGGFFVEADIYASNRFVTRVGGRAEVNSLQNAVQFDPRISMAYKAGEDGQVSVAYGKFRQTPKNEFVGEKPSLYAERAEHFIVNYQRITNNRTFRIETYYKRYTDLIKIEASIVTNNGSGYAKGIELFWRDSKSVDNLDYWISYSLLDTRRNYLNFPHEAVPTFASKHNFSAVAKYFITKIKSQVGATWSVTSRRPFNDPNDLKFNGGRTPSYQDLSFNWSYLPKPYLIVYFSCTNILGRDNIFGYEYSTRLNENGVYNSRAIKQAAPRFIFVGIFVTLSKDKSVNQLPTL